MRRVILIAGILAVIVVAACSVHYDGRLRAVDPAQSVTIEGSNMWYAPPKLAVSTTDSDSVFVIAPQMPVNAQFHAVHVDTRTGTQHRTMISLGADTPFRVLEPPRDAAIEVRGLRWNRPVFHLMNLSDRRAAGFDRVDSATGEVRIVLQSESRPLLTSRTFNSSRHAGLLTQVSADPDGGWVAAVVREPAGWTLHLFPRRARAARYNSEDEVARAFPLRAPAFAR